MDCLQAEVAKGWSSKLTERWSGKLSLSFGNSLVLGLADALAGFEDQLGLTEQEEMCLLANSGTQLACTSALRRWHAPGDSVGAVRLLTQHLDSVARLLTHAVLCLQGPPPGAQAAEAGQVPTTVMQVCWVVVVCSAKRGLQ